MLHAVGLSVDDLKKPQIGIVSTGFDGNPCNMHLNDLARQIKEKVNSNNQVGLIFNTIGVSDGISMGTSGMNYSLPSRDIIADSIETVMNAQSYDGLVTVVGCDKNMPGAMMAIGRLNRPSILVYGGTIAPGHYKSKKLDVVSAFEVLGEKFAGTISDHVFQSRRGPVAGVLYGIMLVGAVVLTFTYTTPIVGWLVVFMSMAVIGVHGMLSGTASMDFGGAKNAGIAVGIIDGFVYLGTGVMSLTYFLVLPKVELDAAGKITGAATDPANWQAWPIAMIPLALIGFLLALRLWNAKPKPKTT